MARTQRAQKTQSTSSQSTRRSTVERPRIAQEKTKRSTRPEIDVSTPKKSSEVMAQQPKSSARSTPTRGHSSKPMASRSTSRQHSTTKRAR